ncbi:MAG TPA: hypothetical protein VFT13_03095 [Candidatus Krumholzibacteria bacterium]|nr:hypothetical protein [Candidatus Krumholzibacteria bacterium]
MARVNRIAIGKREKGEMGGPDQVQEKKYELYSIGATPRKIANQRAKPWQVRMFSAVFHQRRHANSTSA